MAMEWAGEPFTTNRADFHRDNAIGHEERENQTVRATAKSLVDDGRRQDHPQSVGTEVLSAAEENQRRIGGLNVVIQQRQTSHQLDLTFRSKPAHAAAFN